VAGSGTAQGLSRTGSQQTASPVPLVQQVHFVSSAVVRTAHRAAVDRAFADFNPSWLE